MTRTQAHSFLTIVCSLTSAFGQSRIQQDVTPGVLTDVAFTTLPNAVCTLRATGGDNQPVLKLYADNAGNVQFQTKAPADGEYTAGELEADCAVNDNACLNSSA